MAFVEKNQLYPLLFEPIYKEIMWGGDMMVSHLGRKLPESTMPVAESWEVSDRGDGQSVVENGEMKGESLHNLMEHFGRDLIGPNYKGGPFPLLVKIIDAGKRLSLQVHPDEAACEKIGEGAEPKTEMWYIIAAKKGAKIIAGLKPSSTRCQFVDLIKSPEVENCLQTFDSVPRDAFFINAGRIHAIGAGNLLLEIQQNSNTTYRVSDWGRVGPDGKPRELHVEKALECISFMDRTSPRVTGVSDQVEHNRKFPIIRMCPFFKVDDLRLIEKWSDNTESTNSFHLITPIDNTVQVGLSERGLVDVEPGRTCVIPACYGTYEVLLTTEGESTVVKTTL